MKIFYKIALATTVTLGGLSSSVVMADMLKLDYKKGEMMCLVSSSQLPDTEDKISKYFQGVGPLIQAENIEFQGSFLVEKVLSGQHRVPGIGIIKLPSRQSKIRINETRLSEWQHIRETRPDIWEELRLADFELKQDKSFAFDGDKYYQLEAFWVKTDKLNEFSEHLKHQDKQAEKLGGKRVHQFSAPFKYETLGVERAPDVYVITEWSDKKSFESFWQHKKSFRYLAGHDAWLTKLAPPRKAG